MTEEKKTCKQMTYGNVQVNWQVDDTTGELVNSQLPSGVRVFYRQYQDAKTQVPSIRVVVYVHDKTENKIYFQTCVHHKDQVYCPSSKSFSRPTHRQTALSRLMKKPLVMDLLPEDYSQTQKMETFRKNHGDFTWDKYYETKDSQGLLMWSVFEDKIVERLVHPPQLYYRIKN
jgi:hypothetical protein